MNPSPQSIQQPAIDRSNPPTSISTPMVPWSLHWFGLWNDPSSLFSLSPALPAASSQQPAFCLLPPISFACRGKTDATNGYIVVGVERRTKVFRAPAGATGALHVCLSRSSSRPHCSLVSHNPLPVETRITSRQSMHTQTANWEQEDGYNSSALITRQQSIDCTGSLLRVNFLVALLVPGRKEKKNCKQTTPPSFRLSLPRKEKQIPAVWGELHWPLHPSESTSPI
ncbi:hypothetical protein F4679DRAFT_53386 [Xylaria curta]|nr:hypothetical protein F4679DRAFT_53386 [Xylaria curta]